MCTNKMQFYADFWSVTDNTGKEVVGLGCLLRQRVWTSWLFGQGGQGGQVGQVGQVGQRIILMSCTAFGST